VTWRRARALATGLAAWAALGPRPAAGQAVLVPIQPAQPARSLLTTEVTDARALWVNPAGLARQLEASIGADVTADRFAGGTQLSQYGATIASRGVAAGWVHDRYPSGPAVNAYSIGFGLGDEGFSAGTVRRWYTGRVAGIAWDVGARIAKADGTQLSLVARNLGSPRLGDSTYRASFVPGALFRLLDGRLSASGEWEVQSSGWRSSEFRFGGTIALTPALELAVHADLAPNFRRRGFVVALSFAGPQSRAGAFAFLPGAANEVDAFGVGGALVARTASARR
jgi:hypothetical protein